MKADELLSSAAGAIANFTDDTRHQFTCTKAPDCICQDLSLKLQSLVQSVSTAGCVCLDDVVFRNMHQSVPELVSMLLAHEHESGAAVWAAEVYYR